MRQRVSGLAAAALALTLGGCLQLGDTGPVSTTIHPGPQVTVREDMSRRFIALIGPTRQHDPPFLGVPSTNYACLRTFFDRETGAVDHEIYVSDSYDGAERGWQAARDPDGKPLRFIAIGHAQIGCEGGCSYLEEFAAIVPDAALRQHPQGLVVTFSARSGAEKPIAISDEQIALQLAAIDDHRRGLPSAVASATPSAPPPAPAAPAARPAEPPPSTTVPTTLPATPAIPVRPTHSSITADRPAEAAALVRPPKPRLAAARSTRERAFAPPPAEKPSAPLETVAARPERIPDATARPTAADEPPALARPGTRSQPMPSFE